MARKFNPCDTFLLIVFTVKLPFKNYISPLFSEHLYIHQHSVTGYKRECSYVSVSSTLVWLEKMEVVKSRKDLVKNYDIL